MSGGVHTPPRSTASIASRIWSVADVLGMNPEAPKSMQRRITAGSSFADTITTGTPGYCARMYMRPENPRTPGIVRSSKSRSMSPARSSSMEISSKQPASAISPRSNRPVTASRSAPRNNGWSSAITSRQSTDALTDAFTLFRSLASPIWFGAGASDYDHFPTACLPMHEARAAFEMSARCIIHAAAGAWVRLQRYPGGEDHLRRRPLANSGPWHVACNVRPRW